MLTTILEKIKQDLVTREDMTLREFFATFSEYGLVLLLILFALPISLPIFKPPGLSTIIGTPLLLIVIQIILGKTTPWIPKKYEELRIPSAKMIKVIDISLPAFRWVGKFFKPRITSIPPHIILRFIGITSFVFCLPILTPFPFSNAMPALAIVLMGCAYLARDAIGVLLSFLFGAAWLIMLVMVGKQALDYILSWFFGGSG